MQASGSSAFDAPSARRTSTASSSTDSFVQAPRREHQSPRPLRFADLRSVRNRLVFQADSEAPPSIGRNKQSCDTPPLGHDEERSRDGRARATGSAGVPDVVYWFEKALDIVQEYRDATFVTSSEVGDGFIEADGTHRADVV